MGIRSKKKARSWSEICILYLSLHKKWPRNLVAQKMMCLILPFLWGFGVSWEIAVSVLLGLWPLGAWTGPGGATSRGAQLGAWCIDAGWLLVGWVDLSSSPPGAFPTRLNCFGHRSNSWPRKPQGMILHYVQDWLPPSPTLRSPQVFAEVLLCCRKCSRETPAMFIASRRGDRHGLA